MESFHDADSESEYESLNMQEVAVALNAAVNDTSDDNLRHLLHEVNFDVLTLANLARGHQNTQASTTLLLSTAVMVAGEKANDAETKANAANAKATEAQSKAAEAREGAIEAQETSNFSVGLNQETASALRGQGEHIAHIMRRLSALEAVRSTPSPSAVGGEVDQTAALQAALAATNARLEAAEKELDKYRGLVEKAILPFDKKNPFNGLAAGMKVLADIRQKAISDEFQRRDYARQLEVEKLRAELAQSRQENGETKAFLREVLFQFRTMRTYTIARLDGDLSSEELKERLRGLELSGGPSA